MRYNITVHSIVYEEIVDAVSHYESIGVELGIRFEEALQKALDKLEIRPLHYYNLEDKKHRRIVLEGFPYSLIYSVSGSEVTVKMLFFQLQDPAKIWSRLKL